MIKENQRLVKPVSKGLPVSAIFEIEKKKDFSVLPTATKRSERRQSSLKVSSSQTYAYSHIACLQGRGK